MYALPKRPKEKEKKKVRLSFSNWILGGPILQPANREEHIRRRSSGSRKLELVNDENKVKRRVTVGGEKAVKETKSEKAADDKPANDKPADEKLAEEKPAEERPAEEKPAEEKPAEEKPAEEKPAEEKPAEEKSAEEKKPEDGDKAKEKEGGKKENGKKEFSAEQDADILKLKEEGKTWREVATAVKRSQKDCQARFKELEKGEKKESEGEKKDDATIDGEPVPDAEEKTKKKDKKSEKKGDKVENANKRKAEEATSAEHVGGKRLRADDIWTKDDCKTLEMLEERYREQKWLQIQASFYNHTGRMVIADLIEKKFKEVES